MSSATPAADNVAFATPNPSIKAAPKAHVHMPPLDGIRGLAILIVLFGHVAESIAGRWEMPGPLQNAGLLGWVGVDLFFVLSGFLITGILYESKGGDHYFRNFYARRALRIFPLYYSALVLVMIFSAIAPQLHLMGWADPAWLFIYATNYKLAFGEIDMFGVFDHFWSLAVEEHYYLVWPTIVFFFKRKTLMAIAGVAMVLAMITRVSSIEDGVMAMGGYAMTHARMDSLAAGSMIALAVRGPKGFAPFVKPAFVVFGVALAGFLAIVIGRRTITPHDMYLGTIGLSLLWATFGSLLIIALTWKPATIATSNSVLRWFGKYSYGMYVWHPPIFILFMHTNWGDALETGNPLVDVPVIVGTPVVLVIIVSLLSWHLWEKQMLKLKKNFEH